MSQNGYEMRNRPHSRFYPDLGLISRCQNALVNDPTRH